MGRAPVDLDEPVVLLLAVGQGQPQIGFERLHPGRGLEPAPTLWLGLPLQQFHRPGPVGFG
jgi:hypothetical protein